MSFAPLGCLTPLPLVVGHPLRGLALRPFLRELAPVELDEVPLEPSEEEHDDPDACERAEEGQHGTHGRDVHGYRRRG